MDPVHYILLFLIGMGVACIPVIWWINRQLKQMDADRDEILGRNE